MAVKFTTHQERVLDKIARERCLRRGLCQKCKGASGDNWLQWSHVFTRGRRHMRWSMDNCLCLCKTCHDALDASRKNKLKDFVVSLIGDDSYWALHRRMDEPSYLSFEEIKEELEAA